MPEVELGSQSPVSYEEDFEELSSDADLYVFNHQMVQGYRGVSRSISSIQPIRCISTCIKTKLSSKRPV